MIILKRLLLLSFSLLLCLPLWPGSLVRAEDKSRFQLDFSVSQQELSVTVTAKDLTDLYAYDLILIYDPLRLKFLGSASRQSGFSVEPILSGGGKLRLAHTKTGAAKGTSGTAELEVLRFQRIRGGAASVMLSGAKLVDSKLAMTEWKPEVKTVLPAAATPARPTDIDGHWAAGAIHEAVELGYVTGDTDGAFRPEDPVTREEFAAMLARALLLAGSGSKVAGTVFADQGHIAAWALPYVQEAVRARLVNGYEDHTFRGQQPIVRQELAAMMSRALGGAGPSAAATAPPAFSDSGLMEPWAKSYAQHVAEAGIMQGKEGGRFAPLERTTRAEAATVLLRLLNARLQ